MNNFQEDGEEPQACGTSTYLHSKQAKSSTFLRSLIAALSIACNKPWCDGTCYGRLAHIACPASSFCQLGSAVEAGRWCMEN